MVFEKSFRLGKGEKIKIYPQEGGASIYLSENNSTKHIILENDTLIKEGVAAYCEEALPVSGGMLYRIRDKLIIRSN